MIVVGFLMWLLSPLLPVTEINQTVKYVLISLLSLTAIFFLAAGTISFRLAKTTVNPLKPQSTSALVTSGIYQITRNPMYVGFAIILCAWAIFINSPWLMSLTVLFIIYIQRFQIQAEEKALKDLFGDEFMTYKNQVRPWL